MGISKRKPPKKASKSPSIGERSARNRRLNNRTKTQKSLSVSGTNLDNSRSKFIKNAEIKSSKDFETKRKISKPSNNIGENKKELLSQSHGSKKKKSIMNGSKKGHEPNPQIITKSREQSNGIPEKKRRRIFKTVAKIADKVFPFSKTPGLVEGHDDSSSSIPNDSANEKYLQDQEEYYDDKNNDSNDRDTVDTLNTSNQRQSIQRLNLTNVKSTNHRPSFNEDFISFDFDDDQFDNNDDYDSDTKSIASSIRSSFKEFEKNLLSVDNNPSATSHLKGDEPEYDESDESNDQFPWIRNHDHSKEREIADWLTLEIKDFVMYMSPSEEEIRARNDAVLRVKNHISKLWPDSKAHVFGSYACNLYLPGSDIDVVVISSDGRLEKKTYLYQLSRQLARSGMASNIETIAKARVPIIKFVDIPSKVHIDISFERENGLKAVDTIQRWIQLFPSIRSFAIVIKHFLARRKLNEVHTGGLGGFSTICLIVSFLANHPRVSTGQIDIEGNLGVLLIEFFELYGKHFNYDVCALKMTDDMCYLRKDDYKDLQGQNVYALSIQDPNDATNNLTRGTFNTRGLKRAFGGAYELLISKCYELQAMQFKRRIGQSILGNVLKVNGPKRLFVDSTDKVTNIAVPILEEKKGGEKNKKRKRTKFYDTSDDISSDLDSDGVTNNAQKYLEIFDSESSNENDSDNPGNLADYQFDDDNDSRLSQIKARKKM